MLRRVLPDTRTSNVTVTTADLLADPARPSDSLSHDQALRWLAALARVCQGREAHAAQVYVKAVCVRHVDTRLSWRDDFTGEAGELGELPSSGAAPVIRMLFAQLRGWRTRCEVKAQPRAKAVGA